MSLHRFLGTVDTGAGNGPAVYRQCLECLERIGAEEVEVQKGRIFWKSRLEPWPIQRRDSVVLAIKPSMYDKQFDVLSYLSRLFLMAVCLNMTAQGHPRPTEPELLREGAADHLPRRWLP